MGIDTFFFGSGLTLDSDDLHPDTFKPKLDEFIKNTKIISDEGDELICDWEYGDKTLKPVINHRGTVEDWIPWLIKILNFLPTCNIYWFPKGLPYEVCWGNSCQGILYIGDDKIKNVEVDMDGKIKINTYDI